MRVFLFARLVNGVPKFKPLIFSENVALVCLDFSFVSLRILFVFVLTLLARTQLSS